MNENTNYRFLVLIDFSEGSYEALKYSISLAKHLKGEIHLFHVGDSTQVVQSENPLVALRNINEEDGNIKKKLNSIVEIIEEEKIKATYEFSYGNDRDLIENKISSYNPDLTIIGRRKLRLNYRGKITSFLLNQYEGCLLIASDNTNFNAETNISIACDKLTLSTYRTDIIYDLSKEVTPPLSIVNILNSSSQNNRIQFENSREHFKIGEEQLRFFYPINPNIAEGLIEHVEQNQTELICIGRSINTNWILNRFFGRGSTSLNIVSKVNIPILILENKSKK